MDIYSVHANHKVYAPLGSKDDFPRFQGQRLAGSWRTVKAWFLVFERGKRKPIPELDMILGEALACSDRALSVLSGQIRSDVEILPINVIDHKYWVLNIINVVDCLDEGKVTYDRKGNENLSRCFNKEPLVNVSLFKTPERLGDIFATERFYDEVISNSISGLEFRNVA